MMGQDGFDHFGDDDFNYDDTMPPELSLSGHLNVDVEITPETGRIELVGQAAILEGPDTASASGTSWAVPKIAEEIAEQLNPRVLEDPKDLLWTPIARLIMSPAHFRGEWLQHLSDMNSERYECLKRGNLLGAHLAVIRAHFYSLPVSWLLIPVRFILHLLKHWLGC
jgi:hypothetical protein